MSDDVVTRFEFQQFKQVTESKLGAVRALVSRPLPVPKQGERGFPGRDAVIDQKALARAAQEALAEIRLPQDGAPGRDGVKGDAGPRGAPGPQGPPGPVGPMPNHEWKGTELRFELPDGEWGKYVDLQGPAGAAAVAMGGGGTLKLPTPNSWFPSGW